MLDRVDRRALVVHALVLRVAPHLVRVRARARARARDRDRARARARARVRVRASPSPSPSPRPDQAVEVAALELVRVLGERAQVGHAVERAARLVKARVRVRVRVRVLTLTLTLTP